MMRMAGFTVALALMVIGATIAFRVDGNEFSHHQEVEILRHLKRLNKPAVKSIKVGILYKFHEEKLIRMNYSWL